ncbi:hypothetical protein HHI36_014191 [Cryptolaemus montrouzieri]|uniref:Uncharacterized protein n=1 Tax=Cryptolaemus montrouzieri TaxID=559131 RepID=A0ABD2N263_9CUCU
MVHGGLMILLVNIRSLNKKFKQLEVLVNSLVIKSDVIARTETATGAYRTSPSKSLCRETGEMPLSQRRQSLLLANAARISADDKNIVRKTLYLEGYSALYEREPKLKAPIYYTIKHSPLEINFPQTIKYKLRSNAPWTMKNPHCDYSIIANNKSEINPILVQQLFRQKMTQT